jgi:hypothetical protein
MKKIEVYDPAMCCSTGVCGTDVDSDLVQFARDVEWLKEQGASVVRFNLAQQPAAFATNDSVRSALATQGNECLPLILANGEVVMKGVYPTRQQLALLAGAKLSMSTCCGGGESKSDVKGKSSDCCSGESSKSSCC